MKHTYKITKWNEWKNFNPIFLTLIGLALAGLFVFYFRNPDDNFGDFLPFLGIGFLLLFIPISIIHLKYDAINEGMEMIYDEEEKRVVIKNTKKNTLSEFSLDDIHCIYHTMSLPMLEKRMHWFPWDGYNYSDIYLKNGEKHRITSLMVYRLELPVGDRYEVITRFYPYPGKL